MATVFYLLYATICLTKSYNMDYFSDKIGYIA